MIFKFCSFLPCVHFNKGKIELLGACAFQSNLKSTPLLLLQCRVNSKVTTELWNQQCLLYNNYLSNKEKRENLEFKKK